MGTGNMGTMVIMAIIRVIMAITGIGNTAAIGMAAMSITTRRR